MAKVICYLVAAAIAVFSTCISAMHINSQSRKLFQEHMNRVTAFTCGQPQLRAIKPEELGLTISSAESIYPSSTVLKRCNCAGYCPSRQNKCAASETVTVELVFKVMNQVNQSDSVRFTRVNATHETNCSCQPISDQIK